MNAERIRQVANDIFLADMFDIRRFWFSRPDEYGVGRCGTPGCIAGFTCTRYEPDAEYGNAGFLPVRYDPTYRAAQRLLDLTDEQAKQLFTPWEILGKDDLRYPRDVVVRTLRRFADTGQIEWERVGR